MRRAAPSRAAGGNSGAPHRWLIVGFALALGLLAAVAGLQLRQSARSFAATERVAHSHEVRAATLRLLSLLQDVESGMRGFAVTGDPAYLEPFNSAVDKVHGQLAALRALTADKPRHQAGCEVLEPLIEERIAHARVVVETRRASGLEDASREIATGPGKALMEQIRARIAEMDALEQTLLEQRLDAAVREAGTTRRITFTGFALGFAVLIAILALVLRENKRRQQAQAQVDRFFTLPGSMLCIAGLDGRFKRVGRAFEETLGHPASELLSRPLLDFVHPDDRAATAAELAKLRQGEPTIRFENRYRCADGTWRWLSWISHPYPKEALIYVSARDITQSRLAEQAVRAARDEAEAANRLKSVILQYAAHAIIASDPDCLIHTFNPAAEKMLGYSADEVVNRQTPALIHDPAEVVARARELSAELGEEIEPGNEVFLAKARRNLPNEHEWTYIRKDGTRFPVSLSVTALRDAAGVITGFLGIAVDITDRKKADRAIRAKNEELKALAYTMSHDLKAPLRGIAGYAGELDRRHKDGLGERARFCIEQILVATRNLDYLIEDLLKYSRVDAETPTTTEVQLPELVEGILRDRRHTMDELGAEVTVEVPVIVLRSWERGLRQALANLIDNALKYSRNARPPRIAIRAEPRPGLCRISIADNGIGFDMQYHDRIFGLFNRLVRANEFEGTGAGLAIVRKLVEKLGGTIRAESQPGQGATFIMDLPGPLSTGGVGGHT